MATKQPVLKSGKHEFAFNTDTCRLCGAPFQAFVEGATQTCPMKKAEVVSWRKDRAKYKIQEIHA